MVQVDGTDDPFADDEGIESTTEGAIGRVSVPAIVEIPRALAKRKAGRLKKDMEVAVLAAINEAMPPAKIAEAIKYAYDFSVMHESPKGVMAVLEFVVAYQLGSPIKRVVTQRSTVEELLSQAAGVDDEEFDGLIDALYDEHSAG